jgi:hypothetical protein
MVWQPLSPSHFLIYLDLHLQVFHTDLGDILALYSRTVDPAGAGLLASSWQVYNELALARPDIVRTLSEEWVWDTYVLTPMG